MAATIMRPPESTFGRCNSIKSRGPCFWKAMSLIR